MDCKGCKKCKIQEGSKIDSAIRGRNVNFLNKVDLQIAFQALQERDQHIMRAVFSTYQFLWYFTGGLFLLYNWFYVIKNNFEARKQKKVQAMKQSAETMKAYLESQKLEPVKQKKDVGKLIICKKCGRSGGALMKIQNNKYVHQECIKEYMEKSPAVVAQ